MDLGTWIRESRKTKGWTQTDVGTMLGVSQVRVSQWETGKNTPDAEELRQLEIAFGEAARTEAGRGTHSAAFGGTSPATDEEIAESTFTKTRTGAVRGPMITGQLKSKVDRIWDTMWSGGISNPLSVIEQLTYLLAFPRRKDYPGGS